MDSRKTQEAPESLRKYQFLIKISDPFKELIILELHHILIRTYFQSSVLQIMFIWVALFTLLTPSLQTDDTLRRYTSLYFPGDGNSFISSLPDISPFADVFSFCGWFRKSGSAGWPIILSYGGEELRIQDDGGHNCIFGSGISLRNKFAGTKGSWYHYCSTWSSKSREYREYLDGDLIASRSTAPGRQLQTGLQFTLGNYGGGGAQSLAFQGIMFNVNLYAKEFSEAEVKRMSGDMCDLRGEGSVYRLSWQNILEQPRNGTISEVDSGCLTDGAVKGRLEEARSGVEQSQKDLKQAKSQLSDIVSQQMVGTGQILDSAGNGDRDTTALLELTTLLNKKNEELTRIAALLQRTVVEIKEEGTKPQKDDTTQKKRGASKWDILYSDDFFNKTITPHLSEKLRESWDTFCGNFNSFLICNLHGSLRYYCFHLEF